MMRRMQAIVIISLFCMTASLPVLPFGSGYTLTHTSTGDTTVTITFNGQGEDTSTAIEIEKMATVESASFTVEGSAQSSTYPSEVVIDVNDDGDVEWAFDGEGYGSLGHQTVFTTDETTEVYLFNTPGSKADGSFSIPKGATVNSATMSVSGGGIGVTVWDDDFSTNLGWTGYGGVAEWERGPAASGSNDPSSDHSPTTDNYLVGNDIGGSYSNNIGSTQWLTSPTIDCSTFTNVYLDFYRVLNIEHNVFDHAYVAVYNGASWTNVWTHNGGTISETSWSLKSYDVSTYADNNANFKVRFGLGSTDSSVTYGGWNIDDVRIYGDSSDILNPSVDIGNDGNVDWSHVGILSSTVVIPDFSSALNTLLQGSVSYTDPYGNGFVNISILGSVGAPGALTLSNPNIQYSYQAVVSTKPGSSLVAEINGAIPSTGDDNQTILISVSSETAGKVTLSNFDISYDARPKLRTIPDLSVYEDTADPQVLDLGQIIIDDTESLLSLDIQVSSNSMAEYIGLSISEDHQYLVFTPLVVNWNSVTTGGDIGYVELTVTDSQTRSRVSNVFAVDVLAVNDEPVVKDLMEEFSMVEDDESDLFLEEREYFIDYEYDILYYAVEVDPLDTYEGELLTVKHSLTENKVTLTPGENFNTYEADSVPVWVYCDDDPDVDTLEDGAYVHQEVLIYIEPVNDKPEWLQIDPITIIEDTPAEDVLDLRTMVTDIESSPDELEYDLIENKQHAYIGVTIDETDKIDITSLKEDWTGTAEIEIEVRDEEEDARTTITIIVEAVNDAPTISVTFPSASDKLSGTVAIKGQSSDPEKDTVVTEFRMDGGQWTPVDENGPIWTYNWDTLAVSNGEHTFTFRGFDDKLYSEEVEVKFQVENIINEPPTVTINEQVGDSNISGVITISGIAFDTDAVTNVTIQIDGGPWMVVVGTSIWSYQWNTTTVSNGPHTIVARAHDGELYSQLTIREVYVDNTDDLGGSTPIDVGGDDNKESGDGFGIWLWIIIIVIIVVMVIILVFALTRKKDDEEASMGAEPATSAAYSGAPTELQIAQPTSPAQSSATALQYGTPASTGYAGYPQYGAATQGPATQYPPGTYGQPTTYQAGQYQMAASPYAAAAQQAQTQQTPSYQMSQGQPVAGYLPSGQAAASQAGYQGQAATSQPGYQTQYNTNQYQ